MNKKAMEKYFSEFFNIISQNKAKQMQDTGDKSFSILYSDGSDSYADGYDSFEDILKYDCIFGKERLD